MVKEEKKQKERKLIYLGIFSKDISVVYQSKEEIPKQTANPSGDK